jgi:methyl-accepting chemotaxis protein
MSSDYHFLRNHVSQSKIKQQINNVADLNNDTFVKDSGSDSATALITLSHFTSGHQNFLHTYVGTDTGLFDQRPYITMSGDYDPRQRPWYKEAMQHPGGTIVTAPYKDAVSDQMVITIAEALPNKHGVVGADVTLKSLTQMASQVNIGTSGYLAIFDAEREAIVDKGVATGTTVSDHGLDPIFKLQSGSFSDTSKGSGRDMIYETNPATGWKIVGVMFSKEYSQAANPILITMLWVLFFALIVGIVIALLITRSVTKRLKLLVAVSDKVANGDLSKQIEIQSNDELSQLGRSFNSMVAHLRSLIRDIVDSSEQVAASSEELTSSADQTSQATEHITASIQEVAADTEIQTNHSAESANVVAEMTQGIQQIAKSAEEVTASAISANEVATREYEEMQSVINDMASIHTSVSDLEETIKELGAQSEEIHTIVEAITGIAAQTNLLALNAAIEAARAGENGRGFAVVADEVRTLAVQSAESAKKIAETIGSIQEKTARAVHVTAEVSEKVGSGLEAVNVSGKSFAEIRESVNSVANQIQEVSAAVEELLASSDEVTIAMNQISTTSAANSSRTQNVSAAAEEQLASMEEITASSQSLAKMAEHLQEIVERFKL